MVSEHTEARDCVGTFSPAGALGKDIQVTQLVASLPVLATLAEVFVPAC